jgi:hypothetical protein
MFAAARAAKNTPTEFIDSTQPGTGENRNGTEIQNLCGNFPYFFSSRHPTANMQKKVNRN